MPLEKIEVLDRRIWALWKVAEDENDLAGMVAPYEKIPDGITNPQKRLESLAGRLLVKTLLNEWGLTFQGVIKNEFGKPFPAGYDFQLSLSHSYPYVAALIDKDQSVGIDLEQPKAKLLRIGPRVLDAGELKDAGDNLTKHCIYWCAKESLIKVHGKKDLIFAEHIKISPFELAQTGDIVGRIIVNTVETTLSLQYAVMENFVLVLSR